MNIEQQNELYEKHNSHLGFNDTDIDIRVPFMMIAWVLKNKKEGLFAYFLLLKSHQIHYRDKKSKNLYNEIDTELRGFNQRTVRRYKKQLKELNWVTDKGVPRKLSVIYSKLDYGKRLEGVKQINNWIIKMQYQWLMVGLSNEGVKINFFKSVLIYFAICKFVEQSNLIELPPEEGEMKRVLLSNRLLSDYLNIDKKTVGDYKKLINKVDIGLKFIKSFKKEKYGKATDILVFTGNDLF